MRTFITLILSLLIVEASAQIKKIEPEFWWSGMKNTEFQLLVYGDNIQNLNPEFANEIAIKEVKKVDNPNYLFITVDTEGIHPGEYELLFKNKDQVAHKFVYEFKERIPHSAERKGFDSSDIIYLLMPDRFANGNPDNDEEKTVTEKPDRSDPDGRHGGDIEGIIQHLDYLEELGITALWSTPLLEDNEPVTSYHGYAQTDYYRIDPRYGTNEDYRRLGDELHRRDMKLIMDYVTNHWGAHHWIVKDLPSQDWVNHWEEGENGFKRSNYELNTQMDPNAAEIDRKTNEDGWFDVSMPDMNQRNPLVLKYMVQNAIWWIEYAGLDGLRVDTYPYNDKEAIAEWTKQVMEEYPNFNIVGEIWIGNQAQIAYWQKDSPVGAIQNFNSHLPSVMDFTLFDAMALAFNEDEQGWNEGMKRIYTNFTADFLYPDINNIMVFMENHDTNRFNQSFPKFSDYKLAMSLIMTVRGIPQVYYGSEIGMQGEKSKGDGDIRRDFPGGWPGDKENAFTDEGRNELQKNYFNFSKKLMNWRKHKKVIHQGKTLHYIPEDNLYVYFRIADDQRVMVLLNNSPKAQTIDLNRFKEGIDSFTQGKDVLSGQNFELTESIKIDGKTPLILELK